MAVTYKVGNMVIIEAQPPECCARCRVEQECRDVLGDGTSICFACATDKEKKHYAQRMFGSKEN